MKVCLLIYNIIWDERVFVSYKIIILINYKHVKVIFSTPWESSFRKGYFLASWNFSVGDKDTVSSGLLIISGRYSIQVRINHVLISIFSAHNSLFWLLFLVCSCFVTNSNPLGLTPCPHVPGLSWVDRLAVWGFGQGRGGVDRHYVREKE